LRTSRVFDADGNITSDCGPRQAAEEPAVACGPGAHFGTHLTYDPLGRALTQTRYRQGTDGDGNLTAGWTTLTTSHAYDPDGNQIRVTDPNGNDTTFEYDLLGRRTAQNTPRDATTTIRTEWRYSPAGDLTAHIAGAGRPDEAITAYSYDDAHRSIDTVIGATNADAELAGPATLPTATDVQNTRTRNLYDPDGNVVGTYTPRSFALNVADPDERFLTRTDYDANGRPIAHWQPAYDHADLEFAPLTPTDAQVSECPTTGANHAPDPVAGVPAYPPTVGVCVTRASYDPAGNLRSVRNPSGARVVTGTPASNADQPANTGIYSAPNRYLEYRYSDDNLVTEVIGPNPAATTDPAHRAETGLAAGRVRITVTAYDASGRATSTVDAADYQTLNTWTGDGLLAATEGRALGAANVEHQTLHTYNHAGQRLTTTTRVDATRSDVDTTSYYSDGVATPPAAAARDERARNQLWELSVKLAKV